MTDRPRDLARLLAYVRPYRWRMALALASLLLGTGFGLAAPQLVRLLIDAAFVAHDTAGLNRAAVLLVLAFAGQTGFGFLRQFLLSMVGERVIADLRLELYTHLTTLPVGFFADRRVGELTSRLASDVTVLDTVTSGSLAELLRQGLVLIGGVTIIAVTSPRLTLVMLSVVPIVIGLGVIYGRYARRISTRVQDQLADAASVLEESLSAIQIVQSFVREEYERRRYGEPVDMARRLAVRRAAVSGAFVSLIGWVIFSGFGLVLWVGGTLVIGGGMTGGTLTAFVLYAFTVGFAVGGLTQLYGQFQQALGAMRRVFELLDTVPTIADPPHPLQPGTVAGHVRFDDVRFAYPEGREDVLTGVTLEAQPGEIIALVGPSGAGKSTLVSLIPRFYDVSSGAVLVDGHPVGAYRLRDLRQHIGLVPQEITLFGGTVLENIAYGRLDASEGEIEAAARAAHAHEFIVDFPDGYKTLVGARGVKLSGGERQRIAIARALLKNPAILILDEATSSLDSASEALIQQALDRLMQGRTTFVIAHRLSTVRRANQILVLDNGRVVERGTHAELLARAGLYRHLHDIQFRDTAHGGVVELGAR